MQTPIITAAVIQLSATLDKQANVATATRLIREAAAGGAQLIVLPELFNALGPMKEVVAQAEPIPGPTSDAMSALADELRITLLAGSIAERSDSPDRAYNTSLLFGPDGTLLTRYRKIHLFDVNLPCEGTAAAVCIRESQHFLPGSDAVVTETGSGRLGLSICYDLRFPELYREHARQQAQMIAVPAAFTHRTGRDHWSTLLKARAIENQAFVLAANQWGGAPTRKYGHSQIIDPWGEVLAEAGEDGDAVVVATLDSRRLEEVRRNLPALEHLGDWRK